MAVSLSKGSKISLAKVAADAGISGGLTKIMVGLGWDVNRYDGGAEFDLDAAAFMLGAEGVQCGTVFCACDEVNVHQNYKDMVIKAKDNSTRVTGRSYGHPVRQIRNALSNKYLEMEQSGVTFEELEGLTVGSLRKAVVEGDVKEGTFMAGQIAGLVSEIRPAKVIVETMFEEADKLLGRKLEA